MNCSIPACNRPCQSGRRSCDRCRQRAYRAGHPIRYAWHNLRHHANERRITVGIDFPIFENFCLQTGYHERRGNDAESLTIDRFDAVLGYEATNIQILTYGDAGTIPDMLTGNYPFLGFAYYNGAVGGRRASQMASQISTDLAAHLPSSGTTGYFYCWCGVNDIPYDPVATIYANIKTIWAYARTHGFIVVANTLTPSNRLDFDTSQIAPLNTLILSDSSLYDYVVRNDQVLTDPGNLTYFIAEADGNGSVHPTIEGHRLLAVNALNTLGYSSANVAVLQSLQVLGGAFEVSTNGFYTRFVASLGGVQILTGGNLNGGGGETVYNNSNKVLSAQGGLILGGYIKGDSYGSLYLNESNSVPPNQTGGSSGYFWASTSDHKARYTGTDGATTVLATVAGVPNRQTYTVPSAGVATINFTVPPGYSDLRVKVDGRCTSATVIDNLRVQVNGDTAGNYDWAVYGSTQQLGQTSMICGQIPGANMTSLPASPCSVNIVFSGYGNTSFHKGQTWQAYLLNQYTPQSASGGGDYRAPNAISSLTFLCEGGGNFVAGTTVTLIAE